MYKVGVIKGDGVGPEIMNEALLTLDKLNCDFKYIDICAGGISIDKYNNPLTDDNLLKAKECDALLLSAVGGPKWDGIKNIRPEQALLKLRKELNLYANLRPAKLYDKLKNASPLKNEIIEKGFDILIVRELTGGIYFGESKRIDNYAYDVEKYCDYEIARILDTAIDCAKKRRRKITLIDKANVLESSRLWREIAKKKTENEDVELNFMYVDNGAMQLIKNPSDFDVIVTSNLFGDILSDEASMLTGSIGMLPSASLSHNKIGMYEPIHGSAPDIAGKNIVNPIAMILSVAMMLRYSFDESKKAERIEKAVEETLNENYGTMDIYKEGKTLLTTTEMGEVIREKL